MILYNSALKHINSNVIETPCDYYKQGNKIVLSNDIILNTQLPIQFSQCDFLYAEIPWLSGFKTFNKNKNSLNNRTYNDLANSITNIINTKKPIYLVLCNALLKKLPNPKNQKNIKLNGDDAIIAWWHTNKEPIGKTTNEICKNFTYKCMGDFMCGFGQSVFDFNKDFVASDFDKNCIGVIKKRLKEQKISK